MTPRHATQPDGISCGPTAVWTAAEFLLSAEGKRNTMSILHLRDMMGTNSKTGTTEVEMARGLSAYGISHTRYASSADASGRVKDVLNWLSNGNLAMLRIMKHGYRHWVLAVGYSADSGLVTVHDPGEHKVTKVLVRQVEKWMAPRGHEWWAIPAKSDCKDLRLTTLAFRDGTEMPFIDDAVSMVSNAFYAHVPTSFDFFGYLRSRSDLTMSIALMNGDEEMLGCYFLAPRQPSEAAMLEGYNASDAEPLQQAFKGLNGVEGVALAVRPECRGLGYGKLLRSMPGELGFDYAFGLQLKSLENLDHWRTTRSVVVDLGDMWMTGGLVQPIRLLHIADNSTAMTAEMAPMQP